MGCRRKPVSPCWSHEIQPLCQLVTLDSHFIQAIGLPGASQWAPKIRWAPWTLGRQPFFLHTLPICCLRIWGHLGWFCHLPLLRSMKGEREDSCYTGDSRSCLLVKSAA